MQDTIEIVELATLLGSPAAMHLIPYEFNRIGLLPFIH